MTIKISQIALAHARAGMTLAEDPCDAGGNSLLAAGTALTENAIASLQRRGVAQLLIAEEETLTPEQLTARREEVAARLSALFRHCGDDPLMMKLHETLLAYRLEGLR